MKKMKLRTTLVIGTAAVCCLFFGGVYLSQNISEKAVLAETKQQTEEEQEKIKEVSLTEIDQMTLREYYADFMKVDPKVVIELEKVYDVDADQLKVKDLSGDQYQYASALVTLYEDGDHPILARNEVEGELGEDGEVRYSLETSLADVNALSSSIDSTKPVLEICENYGVDPNGTISDLTPQMIIDIDQALFEVSDHPKE